MARGQSEAAGTRGGMRVKRDVVASISAHEKLALRIGDGTGVVEKKVCSLWCYGIY